MQSEKDPIIEVIGNIGKWQWFIILALSIPEIFDCWQMLSPSFLAMEPEDYFCKNLGMNRFGNLTEWRFFASPLLSNGNVDKCQIYDLDYENIDITNIRNGSVLTTDLKLCDSWVYIGNNDTLITEVSKKCICFIVGIDLVKI